MKKAVKSIAFLAVLTLLAGCIGLGTFMASAKTPEASSVVAVTDSKPPDKASRTGKHSGKGYHVNAVAVAAQVLGKTEDEVKEAVKTGKVGDLLLTANKVDAFKTAYLAAAKEKLDAAVETGALTQTQADEKYAEAQDKMKDYDGTQHLCGGKDHSRMFEHRSNRRKAN